VPASFRYRRYPAWLVGGHHERVPALEKDVVGGVDSDQIELFVEAGPEAGELVSVDQRHHEQRRARVEVVSVSPEVVETASGSGVLLNHPNLEAATCQVDGGGDPADAGPDHDRRVGSHSPWRRGCSRRGRRWFPEEPRRSLTTGMAWRQARASRAAASGFPGDGKDLATS
jgi:hypothetical protein